MSDSLLTKSSVVIHAIVITVSLAIASGTVSPKFLPSFAQFQLQLGQ